MVGRPLRILVCAVCLLAGAVTAARAAGLPLVELPEKPMAPPLVLESLDGERFDLAAHRGQVVVVNFWATWCAPCRREMPALERAWKHLSPRDVKVVAVNLGDSSDSIRRFLGRSPVSFPVVVDRSAASFTAWQIQGLPTTYVIGPDGRIHYGAIGDREWDAPTVLDPILSLRSRR